MLAGGAALASWRDKIYIAKLQDEYESNASANAPSNASSSGRPARIQQLRQAPPCVMYKKLQSMNELIKDVPTLFSACSSIEETKETKKGISEAKKPFIDLVSARSHRRVVE